MTRDDTGLLVVMGSVIGQHERTSAAKNSMTAARYVDQSTGTNTIGIGYIAKHPIDTTDEEPAGI